MNIIEHIFECANKFEEKFGDSPNAIYMALYTWDRITEETRNFGGAQPFNKGYHQMWIGNMMVKHSVLPKNAVKLVREEGKTVFEIEYILPEIEKNKWRRITLD